MPAFPRLRKRLTWTSFVIMAVVALAVVSPALANSPWLQISALPYTTAYHAFVSAGSWLHVIGGDIGSGPLNKVLVAQVNSDGTVAGWTESAHELPQPLAEQAAVIVQPWVYLLGGTNGRTALRSVISAEIPANDPIGPWQSNPVLLPESRRGHNAVALGQAVYVMGGRDEGGKVREQVYRGTADASGQLRDWELSGYLPQPLSHAAVVASGKYVFLLGGENDRGPVQTAYTGIVSPTGTLVWRPMPSLPRPSSRGTAFVNGAALFYVGGYDGYGTSAETYASPIREDGSFGAWIGWLPLPKGIMGLRATLLNGRVYLAGGFDGARYISNLQFVAIDTPTPVTRPAISRVAGRPDPVPLAMAIAGFVALVSFLVVAVALILERQRPAA